ncbi:unnamed protein product [Sphenostylis stenocarpa]|uniref:Uncharacterized protein n=1 Tax=Sphenostylis stenocarpa TaxID=92480 RepID=A0AA86SPH2_9FABA|nr:unnamed protein product [Sphenostylis stenocarpa]
MVTFLPLKIIPSSTAASSPRCFGPSFVIDACSLSPISGPRCSLGPLPISNTLVMLHAEKQRGDEYERKYIEAQGSKEELSKKLAETEKRVYQLQDSLNRMISSMSSQVAELKTILSTSSRLSSTFRPIARVDVASSNSDTSSSDSDFTLRAPVSNPEPQESNSFQLVVQDVTAGDGSGTESGKEDSFDDFF